MDLIQKEGYPVTTAVVVTNTDGYKEVTLSKNGKAEHGEHVLTVTV